MRELGLNPETVAQWYTVKNFENYTLLSFSQEHGSHFAEYLDVAIRRAYLSDDALLGREEDNRVALGGTFEGRQREIVASKLPGLGSTMAGDFGEILTYAIQSALEHPRTAFGPKKWALKQDRTKPAPKSDVVHFVLPDWPSSSNQDKILCAEVKMKSTPGGDMAKPIESAIEDCKKDRTSRLSDTLDWLKERAIHESLGDVQISHLNRFIQSDKHPLATKSFSAVVVVCSHFVDEVLAHAPESASQDFQLLIITVPDLKEKYEACFAAALEAIVTA